MLLPTGRSISQINLPSSCGVFSAVTAVPEDCDFVAAVALEAVELAHAAVTARSEPRTSEAVRRIASPHLRRSPRKEVQNIGSAREEQERSPGCSSRI